MAQPAMRNPQPPRSRPYVVGPGSGARVSRPWTRWSDWITCLVGIWFFISPWLLSLGPVGDRQWNNWLSGGALVLISIVLLSVPALIVAAWLNVLLGIWIFISPWVLHTGAWPHASWNAWVVGAIAFVCSLWTALSAGRTRPGGPPRP